MLKGNERDFPSFWQLQIAGWAGFYLLVMVVSLPFLKEKGTAREDTWFVGSLFLASCILRPVCRSLTRRSLSWLALEAWALVWSSFLGAASALALYLRVSGLNGVDWNEWRVDALQCQIMLVLWCNLYFGITQWRQSVREKERLVRAEAEAREARLNALRYQLNPHFLFNSLNAVSALVLDGNATAATMMLSQIGEFLRTTLLRDAAAEVPLSDEVAFAEEYLAIEQTRLGDRLRVSIAIAPETLDALVPDMLLQPLVENAVQHGIAASVEGGAIVISSRLHDSRLKIVVRNSGTNGSGPVERDSTAGNGIGLSNTAERLKVLYGDDHKFALGWPEANVCEVLVELPFKKCKGDSECAL